MDLKYWIKIYWINWEMGDKLQFASYYRSQDPTYFRQADITFLFHLN